MTKLKTLKDLHDEIEYVTDEYGATVLATKISENVSLDNAEHITKRLLRQEVIKWIKHLDYNRKKEAKDLRKICPTHSGEIADLYSFYTYTAKREILMEVFNITEEDLKVKATDDGKSQKG